MIRNKNIGKIIVVLLISFFIAFLIELLYFNRQVIKINSKYSPEVLEMKNIKKIDNKYITTDDDSYIKIKSKYINKLTFNYKSNKDFNYIFKYTNINSDKIEIQNTSSGYISKSIRLINDRTKNLKIQFNDKDLEISNIEINNKITIYWIRLLIIFITIFMTVILFMYRKFMSNKLEIAFMIIGLAAGISYILGTPKMVYNSWDDQIHIMNSQVFEDNQMSEYSGGFQLLTVQKLASTGQITTYEEKKELYKEINKIDKATDKMMIQVNNYSPKYNKLVYAPFKLGFVFADIINLGLIQGIIISKLFNLLLYLAIIFFAIKISSNSIKKLIFVIGLLVSNIFLATQFSYDATITASLVLAVSLFIRMLEDKKINNKYLIAFILAIIWASLPKAIYCFFGLLILFIPNEKFKNKKQALGIKISVTCTVILLMATFVLPMLIGGVAGDPRGGNTNASLQFSLILHNPIRFIKILCNFYLDYGVSLIIGSGTLTALGYIGKGMPNANNTIYIITLVFLLYVTFTNVINIKIISVKIKIVLATLILGICILIPTALYLSFTEVGSYTIQGVQARYYIPLLLPLMIILNPYGNNNKKTHKNIPIISFLLLMITILNIQKIIIGF